MFPWVIQGGGCFSASRAVIKWVDRWVRIVDGLSIMAAFVLFVTAVIVCRCRLFVDLVLIRCAVACRVFGD